MFEWCKREGGQKSGVLDWEMCLYRVWKEASGQYLVMEKTERKIYWASIILWKMSAKGPSSTNVKERL